MFGAVISGAPAAHLYLACVAHVSRSAREFTGGGTARHGTKAVRRRTAREPGDTDGTRTCIRVGVGRRHDTRGASHSQDTDRAFLILRRPYDKTVIN